MIAFTTGQIVDWLDWIFYAHKPELISFILASMLYYTLPLTPKIILRSIHKGFWMWIFFMYFTKGLAIG